MWGGKKSIRLQQNVKMKGFEYIRMAQCTYRLNVQLRSCQFLCSSTSCERAGPVFLCILKGHMCIPLSVQILFGLTLNLLKQIIKGGKGWRGESKDVYGQKLLTCIEECLALCPLSARLNSTAAAAILDHSSPGSRWTPETIIKMVKQ